MERDFTQPSGAQAVIWGGAQPQNAPRGARPAPSLIARLACLIKILLHFFANFRILGENQKVFIKLLLDFSANLK